MNRETFNLCTQALDKNLKLKAKKQAEIYDTFYEMLNEVASNNFYDLYSGKLVVLPVGDYISQTIYSLSMISISSKRTL